MSWSLTGLTSLVLAAALIMLGFNSDLMTAWFGFEAVLAGAALLYAGTGWLITRRLPENAHRLAAGFDRPAGGRGNAD
jgi:hypothetical protein